MLGKLSTTGLWYQVWKEMGSVAILGQIWARNRTFLFGSQICNSVDNHFYCSTLSLFRESNIAQLTGCPHPAECRVTMGLAVLKTYGTIPSEIGRWGKLLKEDSWVVYPPDSRLTPETRGGRASNSGSVSARDVSPVRNSYFGFLSHRATWGSQCDTSKGGPSTYVRRKISS